MHYRLSDGTKSLTEINYIAPIAKNPGSLALLSIVVEPGIARSKLTSICKIDRL
jgi:hypothetical protein